MKATRRFSKGLSVIASYTWGKSLDDTSGIRNQGNDNLYPQNSECIACEYGRSAFDVKNRIVGSANYELPFGPGKLINTNKAVGEFVGGWQIGGIFTHQTGQVGTPLLGTDNSSIASPFGGFDRPNPTGTSPYLSGSARSLNVWVNKAAYRISDRRNLRYLCSAAALLDPALRISTLPYTRPSTCLTTRSTSCRSALRHSMRSTTRTGTIQL